MSAAVEGADAAAALLLLAGILGVPSVLRYCLVNSSGDRSAPGAAAGAGSAPAAAADARIGAEPSEGNSGLVSGSAAGRGDCADAA